MATLAVKRIRPGGIDADTGMAMATEMEMAMAMGTETGEWVVQAAEGTEGATAPCYKSKSMT